MISRASETSTAVRPNFLGIGVQRGATTWLHNRLADHPEVYLPREKEVQYFNLPQNRSRGNDWYLSHFALSGDAKAVGEITPTYLHKASPQEVAELLPELKLLVVLRDPVDRAFSAYTLLTERHSGRSFSEACRDPYLVSLSLYAERLRAWGEVFGWENLCIVLYDDIHTDPESTLARIFRFLDVDAEYRPAGIENRDNRIMYPRLQGFLDRIGLEGAKEFVKSTPVGDWIRRRHAASRRTVSPKTRRQLLKVFLPDIEETESLIHRDLCDWKS